MSMLDAGREPGRRELAVFGLLLLVVAAVVGAVLDYRFGLSRAARVIWTVAAVVALAYYCVPALRRPIFFGWTYATFPIGWLVSHAILAAIYFLLITPMGLVMRVVTADAMRRRFDKEAASYWEEHDPQRSAEGYFRRF
jgi:hypothetical protein